MNIFRSVLLATALAGTGWPANLAISTYVKDGFTPTAIASDAQGNVYVAGSAVIDAASQAASAFVAKLDPNATQYLYLAYLDSASSDQVSAIVVDGSGNAYVTGWTTNPNFPAVGGGALGTAPAGGSDSRSFLTKLDPRGAVIFSVLIGGSAMSTAEGIALTPMGQILVSGIAGSKGFPSTPGAYNVADSTNQWFVMELDPTASTTIFSATGIGGSSLALDAAGNIYMAGSSPGTNYPTTPGAYQTKFVQTYYCFPMCQIYYPGNLQHVTKVDSMASKLLYSTGLNDTQFLAGSTTNTGLAVDSAGNAYVTGTLLQGQFPFTVTAQAGATGFTAKLDPVGASVIFSIPGGGGGLQLDSSGSLYVGGAAIILQPFPPSPPPPPVAIPSVFSGIPEVCQPNPITAPTEAYVMKLDPATGAAQDGQWIDGAANGATAIALAGGKVWMVGGTAGPQMPFSAGAFTPLTGYLLQNIGAGFLAGAYLSAVDFSAGPNTGPSIACVLDGGNLTHVGAVTGSQLISIFGTDLGPATGVSPHGIDTSLAGVSVTFDGTPAELLYVSNSQINVAVPVPNPGTGPGLPVATVMQVTVNGASVKRQFPLTLSNLNLFADLSTNPVSCPSAKPPPVDVYPAVATNADGSLNSCTNPAKYGSTVSLFVEGIGGFGPPPSQLPGFEASAGACLAPVTNTSLINGFVYRVDFTLPAAALQCIESFPGETFFPVTLSYGGVPVGPLAVPVNVSTLVPTFYQPTQPLPLIVWVEP